MIDDMIDSVFANMDKDGMYPIDWRCVKCNKQLNADGGHPAELYGGTYNGLCYDCTGAPGFITHVLTIDDCQVWSYPPHCPSWRRDRETAYGYADCTDCGGRGRTKAAGWCRPAEKCTACWTRFLGQPKRKNTDWLGQKIYHAAMAVFDLELAAAAGADKIKAKKRRAATIEDWTDANPQEVERIKNVVLVRYRLADVRLRNLKDTWGVWEKREEGLQASVKRMCV